MLRLANLLHVHDQVLLRDGLERSMAFNPERHRFVISGQLRSRARPAGSTASFLVGDHPT